ncbi:hypothetical protein LIER_28412 [Lithospermum erythrorhizon]|uniref:Uncharacterized protein n=1 Tax=Lithospermum erythrorhizon TaxID=34254 RepID=A0AAV3RLL2_LITER
MERSNDPSNYGFDGRINSVVKVLRRYAKPHSSTPGQNRPKAYVYLGEFCGEDVSGRFFPEMRVQWTQYWPRWKEVDAIVKERLWNNFKNYFVLEVEESTVRHIFYKQSTKWYRRAIGSVKREALSHAQTDTVANLIGKEKLVWMHSQPV